MKVRDVVVELRRDGSYLQSINGSHRQFKHPTRPLRVTVPGHLSKDLAIGTLASIRKAVAPRTQRRVACATR